MADSGEISLRPKLVKAVYNFQPANTDELSFQKGDVITVTQQMEGGWWEGTLNGTTGWFPSNYVREIKSPDSRSGAMSPTGAKGKESKPSVKNEAFNRNVVLTNLVSTEKEFTSELNEQLRLYLQPLEDAELLTTSEYADLLGNLPELALIHNGLLISLEEAIERSLLEQRVGGVMLHIAPQLQALYQKFSANHPKTAAVLQSKREELSRFMEGLGVAAPGVMTLTQGLSKPFRRLDRYSSLLKELERHTDENHPDRGDTQRAIAVYRDMALACSEIRKKKELEFEILHSEIGVWEGEDLNQLGEVLLLTHAAVELEGGETKDRLLLLFSGLLVVLSITPRVSGCVYEGKLLINNNTTVNTVEDSENFSYSLELTGGSSGGLEKLTIFCSTVQEKNKWLTAFKPLAKLGPSCFSPKPTIVASQHAQQPVASQQVNNSSARFVNSNTGGSNLITQSVAASQKPSAISSSVSQNVAVAASAYKPSPAKSSANISCLRPGPPLRPSVLIKEDGSRSPRMTRRIIGTGRRKPVDDAKTLEEDAVMLQIIEGYCTSTKARQTVNSLDLAKIRKITQAELRKDLWDALLENPQVLIAEEEKIIIEEIKDNQTVVEEKTLVDTVYSLKDQVKELKQEQQKLRRDLDNERRARKRLETMLRQSLKSIVENTFESTDTLTNASGSS